MGGAEPDLPKTVEVQVTPAGAVIPIILSGLIGLVGSVVIERSGGGVSWGDDGRTAASLGVVGDTHGFAGLHPVAGGVKAVFLQLGGGLIELADKATVATVASLTIRAAIAGSPFIA